MTAPASGMPLPRISDPHRVLIETGVIACFSSNLFSFELNMGGEQALVRFSRGTGKDRAAAMVGEHKVPASVAADFIAAINAALARPERKIGGRFTTRHIASIAEGEDGSAPVVDLASNDMPREFLEEMLTEPSMTPDLADRIRTTLSQDTFNPAYAIYMLAQQFAHQLGYEAPRQPGPRSKA